MPVLSPLLVACFGPLFLSVALSIAFAVLDFSSVLVKVRQLPVHTQDYDVFTVFIRIDSGLILCWPVFMESFALPTALF
jgi:hypothetical protein